MTFKECATKAWNDKPFQFLNEELLEAFMVIGGLLVFLIVYAGPVILAMDHFSLYIMVFGTAAYWTFLTLGLFFLGKMYMVCEKE